jgi:hypothetical protein
MICDDILTIIFPYCDAEVYHNNLYVSKIFHTLTLKHNYLSNKTGRELCTVLEPVNGICADTTRCFVEIHIRNILKSSVNYNKPIKVFYYKGPYSASLPIDIEAHDANEALYKYMYYKDYTYCNTLWFAVERFKCDCDVVSALHTIHVPITSST